LCAEFGEDIPYKGGLDRGFSFRGRRVPFLSYQKGIYRAAVQTGPAALSINTSYDSPYDDEPRPEGFSYAYRAGSIDLPDNRALRAAHDLQTPLTYFFGTWPGQYRPIFPCYVTADDPQEQRVLVTVGRMLGAIDEPEAVLPDDMIERRYAVRETRVRMHQGRFRAQVVAAYRRQCAICRLKQLRLLDGAHIVGDVEEQGEPLVSNGLSLCSIHHRAFDQDLVGISPSREVHVSRRLLDDEDGPMLELLKGAHGRTIVVPSARRHQPDSERLAARFERFLTRSS